MDIEVFPVVSSTVMLVVGRIRNPGALPRIPGFHFFTFAAVDARLLASIEPEVVLSALIAPDFDALDLAQLLHEGGFRGRYRAVTTRLPNPAAIVSEVRAAVPGLDFDLFVTDDICKG
jgi:hypothetical protein